MYRLPSENNQRFGAMVVPVAVVFLFSDLFCDGLISSVCTGSMRKRSEDAVCEPENTFPCSYFVNLMCSVFFLLLKYNVISFVVLYITYPPMTDASVEHRAASQLWFQKV